MEVFYSLQTMKNRSLLNRLSYTHIVVIGFLLLIVIGTVLILTTWREISSPKMPIRILARRKPSRMQYVISPCL